MLAALGLVKVSEVLRTRGFLGDQEDSEGLKEDILEPHTLMRCCSSSKI